MNILVIASVDATNLSIQNVVREFIERGHKVDVYGRFMDYKSIRMFSELGLEVKPVTQLSKATVKKYDVAFCGTDAMNILRWYDIYVFNYNFIFINSWPTEGSDFMFTICNERPMRCHEDCATMPVGNPKNDTRTFMRTNEKQILYIDAGHTPFGTVGKQRVARMLLEASERFPEYQIVVKPRWLLSDKRNRTHWNKDHIYALLNELADGKLPPNLVLLDRHRDLQELIDESVSVITTSYSCYLDAALRSKGVLIVGGLDSEDKYEVRKNVLEKQHIDLAEDTGCLVDVSEICDYLPYGKMCSEAHLEKLIPYRTGASERIVDVMEWVYENYLSKGLFPEIKPYSYETYRETMCADPAVDFTVLKQKRLRNAIINSTRTFDWVDADINWDRYFETLEKTYRDIPLNEEGFWTLNAQMEDLRKEILIANQSKLMDDPLNQALVFQAYYDLKLYDAISDFPEQDVLAWSPYYYYMGFIEFDRGATDSGLLYISKYFQEVNGRDFEKYYQDTIGFYRKAIMGFGEKYDGTNLDPETAFDIYDAIICNDRPELITNAVRARLNRFANHLPMIGEYLLKNGEKDKAELCLFLIADYFEKQFMNLNQKGQFLSQKLSSESSSRLIRKLHGGIQCVKDNGWAYTVHHAKEKLRGFIGRK